MPKMYGFDGAQKTGNPNVKALNLGEEGRGRELKKIFMDDHIGPFQGLGEIKAGPGSVVRIVPSTAISGWLAVVSTRAGYRRGCAGRVGLHPSASIIATGRFAYGDAGRIGTAAHYLLSLPDNTWVRVRPTTGDSHWLYFSESEAHVLTDSEAEEFCVVRGLDVPNPKDYA